MRIVRNYMKDFLTVESLAGGVGQFLICVVGVNGGKCLPYRWEQKTSKNHLGFERGLWKHQTCAFAGMPQTRVFGTSPIERHQAAQTAHPSLLQSGACHAAKALILSAA